MTPRLPISTVLAASALLLLAAPQALTQPVTSDSSPQAQAVSATKDPLGRDTPQGMVSGLIRALGSGDHQRAARFFETQTVIGPKGRISASGPDLAEMFEEVLDRAGSVTTPVELSSDPLGRLDDGVAEDIERFGMIKVGDTEVVLLARRGERDGAPVWLVSAATLGQIPTLAQSLKKGGVAAPLIDHFPQGPPIAGVPAVHWVALIAMAALGFAIAWISTAMRGPIVRAFRRDVDETRLTRFVEAGAAPIRLLLATLFFGMAIQSAGLSVVARYQGLFAAQVVAYVAAAWLLWRSINAGGDFLLGQMSRRGQLAAYSTVAFLKRALKILLVVVFVAIILRAFGINLTAGLAALGIGGLAIALGAQRLFENLIGSLTVVADRPVRIGDVCRFGDTIGTVEEIGIRSTRIRTLNRTVLTVPNGEFAALHIENYSQRDRFWFHPVLNLRYETSPDQVRYLLKHLRAMLNAHVKVHPEPARVRLVALGAYSVDVEIFAYVMAPNYEEFLEIQEELLLRCIEIVGETGTGFAYPSQTLYLGRDQGLDLERTHAAEKAARRWHENATFAVARPPAPEVVKANGGPAH